MNVTIRQLRAFSAVAAHGSFTAAANHLSLTQSALSVLVRELERVLGVRLFDRHTRSVRLTDAGRDFLPHVARAFVELEGGAAAVADLRDKKRGLLRVGAPQLLACTLLPTVIAAFRGRYPAIDVRLVDTPPEGMLPRVTSGDAELAIGPDASIGPELARLPLMRSSHQLVCPRDHPLARRPKARWQDVARHAFIAPTRDFMKRLAPELATLARPVTLVPAHEVSYMTTALGLTAAGIGITACPSYAMPFVEGYGLAMRPLVEPVFHRTICAFALAGRSLSPAAEAFVEVLRETVAR